ncbi:MAG: hypothetical protein KC592_17320 [Nitrospira sp.]|nr:hypothetical protein [Nitrospira sp.]HBP90711.1 hypothetical protein [Nitrospiraceae bacterium]HNP30177.1 hypothetical protein [Nitrospirales bacterium]
MPVNALRKPGARMSLQEALERVEKLKRLSQSSNPHEAALAAMRLKDFDVEVARTPRSEPAPETAPTSEDHSGLNKVVEILDEAPAVPYETLDEIEVEQDPDKSKVNWDELHFALVKKAQRMGADALIHIELKGTAGQKVLGATALKYLTPREILEIQQSTALEDAEKAYRESQKERLDEDLAPGIG